MIARIIAWSIDHRFLVIFAALGAVVAGAWAVRTTPVDALPDLSDVQVIIQTDFSDQAPQIVEDQVTYPIATEMLKVPGTRVVRGFSFFGQSLVYVLFDDGTDPYWARSRVLEYLNGLRTRLPRGVEPTLGPDATGVGWILEYTLESDSLDLGQLRSLQDWYVRYQLTAIPGVSEVASLGGFVKQYQVEVDPERLRAYDVPVSRVVQAIGAHNADIGARVLEMGGREYMIRGLGYLRSEEDIGDVVLATSPAGVPVRVRDVANVTIGPAPRRGVADLDGRGDVVTGIVVMRYGGDALRTLDAVKARIAEVRRGLPPGVRLRIVYDRSDLIHRAIDTLKGKLLEESLIVAVIAVLFLLHVRSALVAIVTLPAGILLSFLVMRLIGVGSNIMSLGGIAIAIGAMVDAAIVMIENMHQHLARDPGRSRWEVVRDSAAQVGPPLFFSLLVITVSFLPVFALEQQEGRLFKPLAYTKTFAMAGAALLSITLVPVLMGYLVRGRIPAQERNPVNRWLRRAYAPLIDRVLAHPWRVLAAAGAIVALTALPWSRLGSEFMPPLNEGTLLFMPTTVPGVSVSQARALLRYQDSVLKSFPEVEAVLGKAGRANSATDPAPLDMSETLVILKPASAWPRGLTYPALEDSMDRAVRLPGVTNAWTMPIRNRIEMLATGVRTPVGVKIYGPDLDTLQQLGEQVERAVRGVPGTRDVFAERNVSGYYVDVRLDHLQAARYGLNAGDLHDAIMATAGGTTAAVTVEGRERYEINVRYPRELRDNLAALRQIAVPTPGGAQIPLGQVADVRIVQGPMAVKTEDAFPFTTVYVDLSTSDIGSYVAAARRAVAAAVRLPPGYTLAWSGQYEFMARVRQRLQVVVPVTLAIIFVLLYLNFNAVPEALIVMTSLPFALVGGIWSLWALGYNTSVAVWVGFIALAGVAAETGVIMLIYLDEAYQARRAAGTLRTRGDLAAAVHDGAVGRLRPKMMTVTAIMAGLVPILWGTGAGADVMKRIAAPMVGGMLTSAALTLVVIPAIYYLWRARDLAAPRSTPGGHTP